MQHKWTNTWATENLSDYNPHTDKLMIIECYENKNLCYYLMKELAPFILQKADIHEEKSN